MEAEKQISAMRDNIGKVIVGRKESVDLVLTALLAGGHILLEDVPGTGKTMLAKSLAKSLDLQFSRIQFTPDLLPSDVTGLNYFNQAQNRFVLRRGPVFTNILLADEINRATPRTQSSLLESMEERQVTIDGETYPLADPFLVIATQNPIETAGTYPLPEAQMDRFMMQISMGYPDKDEELSILRRFGQASPLSALTPVCGAGQIKELKQAAANVYIHPALESYLVDIVSATRSDPQIAAGASPRGSLAYLCAARAFALVNGRGYVVPEDLKALAVPVLAHRLVPARTFGAASCAAEAITRILSTVPLPTEDWSKRL